MTDVTPELLLGAYAEGVFPMAEDRFDPTLYWYDPEFRGILPLDTFHCPRRLKKTVRSGLYQVTFDQDFDQVIRSCAKPARGRRTTWINDRIVELYTSLFERGFAHSIECWKDNELVGGLYGVALGRAFFGESMFSRQRDASKVALVYLAARLKYGGYELLDTQFITDHLQQFGAVEITRAEYKAMLATAVQSAVVTDVSAGTMSLSADVSTFSSMPASADGSAILQSISQTS